MPCKTDEYTAQTIVRQTLFQKFSRHDTQLFSQSDKGTQFTVYYIQNFIRLCKPLKVFSNPNTRTSRPWCSVRTKHCSVCFVSTAGNGLFGGTCFWRTISEPQTGLAWNQTDYRLMCLVREEKTIPLNLYVPRFSTREFDSHGEFVANLFQEHPKFQDQAQKFLPELN